MRQTLSGLLLAVSGLCIGSGLQAQERVAGPDTARPGLAAATTIDSLSQNQNEEPHELTINERRRRAV